MKHILPIVAILAAQSLSAQWLNVQNWIHKGVDRLSVYETNGTPHHFDRLVLTPEKLVQQSWSAAPETGYDACYTDATWYGTHQSWVGSNYLWVTWRKGVVSTQIVDRISMGSWHNGGNSILWKGVQADGRPYELSTHATVAVRWPTNENFSFLCNRDSDVARVGGLFRTNLQSYWGTRWTMELKPGQIAYQEGPRSLKNHDWRFMGVSACRHCSYDDGCALPYMPIDSKAELSMQASTDNGVMKISFQPSHEEVWELECSTNSSQWAVASTGIIPLSDAVSEQPFVIEHTMKPSTSAQFFRVKLRDMTPEESGAYMFKMADDWAKRK